MTTNKVEGLVLKRYSGFYYVQDEQYQIYECKLRGKIKVAVLTGDRVGFTPLEAGKGILESILPRKNELYRPRIANVNLLLIIMACKQPAPSLILLDKLLLMASFYRLTPQILLNKSDLPPDSKSVFIEDYYPRICLPPIKTSAKEKTGIDLLRKVIEKKIAVFAGPSGAGKSSLLNTLIDGVSVKTQELSKKVARGKHTTRHVELYPLRSGGWIADTPGFSLIETPAAIKSSELSGHFSELGSVAGGCRFNDCLHRGEKHCAVKEAVNEGLIAPSRYKNYLYILEEILAKERSYK
ncbi:MAG: ribosome small subunit-dependent GTPase A [Syntrophomonas sp.]|uniref:ribosome small subunit-dependent GTPase A n=1 Tax=Syntrophomonas sp. TaxID=2053627 RepID=UPI0026043A07|nr:ribosome small subunit-dependent GTPase A [Syntrophomonas sp.]MDD2509734.1 ribosome small subunit-dependent GTPase A [Syntrophomonas sp.]MDD3879074.1 ribosome small subunit-dependent GTPase A [Syntrophomonas sp.]MDD4625866.1 ribosome small subunit-dependent GTPase A [Syntrophomonas sp.]